MRERDVERHLVRRVMELGGEVRKVQWVGRRGAPDRVVMLGTRVSFDAAPGSRTVRRTVKPALSVWVELKAPGVEPEPHQLREHARMRAMGQRVEVIDSIEQVDELLAGGQQQQRAADAVVVKITADRAAAVDQTYHWQPLDTCPLSVKVQLLTTTGVAVYGQFSGGTKGYIGWAPLPKKPEWMK